MADDQSELTLSGLGVPMYSARGLKQSIAPIGAAANLRRTINGKLKDVSMTQFRKYTTTISCDDQRPPACDGLWPGRIVTMSWVARLTRPNAAAANRTVVPGSEITEGDFTSYRPRMNMLVKSFTMDADEWAAGVGWTMEFEEE